MQVPVTVLTGFLGSGKTTLLNRLLRQEHGRKIAVIVNELGQVGIDGKVLQGGEAFVELDNGCLCCALNADLDATLRQLAEKGGFSHLVIETTGVADPLPLGWIVSRPGLSERYRLDAIVTVVDAANVASAVGLAPEALQQIVRADLVLLTKLDLVADGGVAARELVRRHNRLAPIVEAPFGAMPIELILEPQPEPQADVPARPSEPSAAPLHGGRPSLESWVYSSAQGLTEERLGALLDEVPLEVYRIKGLVRTTDTEWTWTLVNGVGGRMDLLPATPERPPGASTLVFIAKQLDPKALAALCDTYFAPLG